MKKDKILFVGDHPYNPTGLGMMMRAILHQLDLSKYTPSFLVRHSPFIDVTSKSYNDLYHIVVPMEPSQERWGIEKLVFLLEKGKFAHLMMVGMDIWAYAEYFSKIQSLQNKTGFKWSWLFPYDLQNVRSDWVQLINQIEHPYVYSKYGFEKLNPFCPNLQYFRPPIANPEMYKRVSPKKKAELRKKWFPSLNDEDFLFGFLGGNQFRKDPQRAIAAFSIVRKDNPSAKLYIHCDMKNGVFNLRQYCMDRGLLRGDVFTRPPGILPQKAMVEIYQSMDCLVNTSLQEGLSYTILEAMLCGTPIVATRTTAQTELIKDCCIEVGCSEHTFLPVKVFERQGNGGNWVSSFVDAFCAKTEDIAGGMAFVLNEEGVRQACTKKMAQRASEYLSTVGNINELLAHGTPKITINKKRRKALLFGQYGSAGDVLMTTRCFKGLSEKYGLPIHYMTQSPYQDIVRGNPYIAEILRYDEQLSNDYEIYVNPHRKYLWSSVWGRNGDVLLSDFYWKILKVKPSDFFIEKSVPDIELPPEYIVVHTTGGDPTHRTYTQMPKVCASLKTILPTVQIGGRQDFDAGADVDLRGQLSYRQSAYVMGKAVAAITVDSFVSHLAGALGISQVCLFGSGNYRTIKPVQVQGELICVVPDYLEVCPILGPCFGQYDCPSPCIETHPPERIVKELKSLL